MKLSIATLGLLLAIVPTFHHQGGLVVVAGFQVLSSTRNHLVSRPSSIQASVVKVPTTTSTIRVTKTSSHAPTALYIFGGLFGGGSSSKLALSEDVPLTMYSSSTTDNDKQYDSLGEYIEKWSKLFTNGNIKLTTPVTVEPVVVSNPEDGESRRRCRGIRLLFKDTKTGYQSKTEEQESNSSPKPAASVDDTQANNKTKKGSSKVKQGGVEILVEQNNQGVQVTAKRCEIEEDTIIKEMSEETILNELKQAIEVWKRETK